jgi:hypothetical protein
MHNALTISKAWRETRWRARNDDLPDVFPALIGSFIPYLYVICHIFEKIC